MYLGDHSVSNCRSRRFIVDYFNRNVLMIATARRQLAYLGLFECLRALRTAYGFMTFLLDLDAQMLAVALEASIRIVLVVLVLFVGNLGETVLGNVVGADNN